MRKLVHIPSGAVELEGALESPAGPRGLVVFAHGSGSSRMSPRNRFVAIELRRLGFATLLSDLLTDTEDLEAPERRFDIPLLAERLQAAVRWSVAQPFCAGLPVGLFGASTGAAAALEVAAALGDAISAVVARGGRPDLAAVDALEQVRAPTLLIVGGNDVGVIGLNRGVLGKLRCAKALHIVPGASHLFEEPGTLETVAAVAAEWFGKHLCREPQAA